MTPTLRTAILALAALAAASASAQDKKIVVGILPVYDSSGQPYGTPVSQILTGMIYQQFASNPKFRPIFLNPGGLYDPTSTAWVAEYVQTLDTPLDTVLSTNFVEPENPKRGEVLLKLKTAQLDVKTGDPVHTWTSSTQIKDYTALVSYTQAYIPTGQFDPSLASMIYRPSPNLDRQPVGKAANTLAAQTVTTSLQNLDKITATGSVPKAGKGGSCTMSLKIGYDYKGRTPSSKSYTAIINEKEESLGIKEGVLQVTEPSSPLLIQIKVMDSPYKLPKQDVYLFDPILDCSSSAKTLKITIGPAGEAHTSWQ